MIKFKLLTDTAIAPKKATPGSAGFDLYADDNYTIPVGNHLCVSTGVSLAIPAGFAGFIWPRSGMAVRSRIDTLAGCIDSDFRGELKAVLINHGSMPYNIRKGDRIAQLVVTQYMGCSEVVDELPGWDRGGGFGHTGR